MLIRYSYFAAQIILTCAHSVAPLLGGVAPLLGEALFDINILIKHWINLVMHYKFEINI